jgi:hypothetical protein
MDPTTPLTDTLREAIALLEENLQSHAVLHAAVVGLTAMREKIPDYSETLRAMQARLDAIDVRLGRIEAKPAMQLTPAVMADEFGKRAVEVRAEDRKSIGEARDALWQSVGRADGIMKRLRSTAEQDWWVTWAGMGGLLFGAFLALIGVAAWT